MNPCGRITIKILELLGCTACLLAKGITDLEEKRIATRNQKLSREWSLLNNVTWDGSGNTFVNITFGGYLIITALMMIARCIDSKSRPNLLEKILLLLGALMFFACGGLILASLEQILPDLYDNAILLGCLSVIVGVLYLIDLADPLSRKVPTMTQTDATQISTISSPIIGAVKLHKDAQTTTDSYPPTPKLQRNDSASKATDTVDFIQVKQYPEKQSPKFATVRESRLQNQQKHQEFIEYPEPWEEFETSITSKPPSIRSARAPTQSPDFGYQSASYVAAPSVDRGNLVIKKARPMVYHYYPEYSTSSTTAQDEQFQQQQLQSPQIKRGYVANAAKIWDSRLSTKMNDNNKQLNSMNTVV